MKEPSGFDCLPSMSYPWIIYMFICTEGKKISLAFTDFLPVSTTSMENCVSFVTATVQEEAGNDHALCQITSERFQKSLQRHLSLYVTSHICGPIHTHINLLFFRTLFSPFFSSLNFFLPLSVILSLRMWSFVVFFSPSADDATRVILKSNDDYINANYINVSLFLLVYLFHFSINISCVCLLWGMVGGLFC